MIFSVKDTDLAARIGEIRLKRGTVETPAFFPVIDPLRQEIRIDDIKSLGFKQVITNAYLSRRRFGDRVAEIGIHRFIGFDGVIMTDSGGYQILEYGDIEVGQDEIIEYQKRIGSDIGVILDVPTGDVSYDEARRTVEITLSRAREALGKIHGSETAWALPIQGGRYLDLVELSARESSKLPGYFMYAIGSPTVFLERYELRTVMNMVHAAKRFLPAGKPVHLFGAGHPLAITLAIALGVDTFDSASYMLYARDGRYMTMSGSYDIRDLDYFPCSCPVCSRRSPKELIEMEERERTRLLAIHNLYVIKSSIDIAKQAIREGRMWELLEELSRKHPKALEAFRGFRRYYSYIERLTPRVKGEIYGLRLYDIESAWNPKILRFRIKSMEILKALPPGELRLRPFRLGERADERLIYYAPIIGFFPSALSEVFPTTQHSSASPSRAVIEDLIWQLRALSAAWRKSGVKAILEYCPSTSWQLALAKEAQRLELKVAECSHEHTF